MAALWYATSSATNCEYLDDDPDMTSGYDVVGVTVVRKYVVPALPDVLFSVDDFDFTRRMGMFGLFAVLMIPAAFSMLKKRQEKNKKGNRMFTKKDVDNLRIIYHLTKERGFTLEGAKKKLRENKADTIDNVEIINHLKNIRQFLVEFREEL